MAVACQMRIRKSSIMSLIFLSTHEDTYTPKNTYTQKNLKEEVVCCSNYGFAVCTILMPLVSPHDSKVIRSNLVSSRRSTSTTTSHGQHRCARICPRNRTCCMQPPGWHIYDQSFMWLVAESAVPLRAHAWHSNLCMLWAPTMLSRHCAWHLRTFLAFFTGTMVLCRAVYVPSI